MNNELIRLLQGKATWGQNKENGEIIYCFYYQEFLKIQNKIQVSDTQGKESFFSLVTQQKRFTLLNNLQKGMYTLAE